MRLGELKPPSGAHKEGKRKGQGPGSGNGKTGGRGHKGQKARSGAKRGGRIGFEGGQMPLHRRLPKIGFSNHPFKTTYRVVNVGAIEGSGMEGEVGPDELVKAGLIGRSRLPVKVLGEGEITRQVTVRAHAFSAKATEKITQAGGQVQKIS